MFRSRAAATRREAVAASKYAEIVFEAFQYLAGFVNTVPIQLRWLSNEPPHIAAQKTRRAFGLIPDKPIPHLIHEIERSGVVVLAIPLNLPRIDAFSAWIGEGSLIPVITICEGRPGDRLRWNVAHELGHLVLHHGAKHLSKENHRDADRFAAELLLPEEGIRRDIIPPVTLAGLAPLKAKWRVAIQAIARRAYDLSIITKRQYTYLFEQIGARGWRTKEPENLDFPAEKPRALMKMAEVAFGNQTDPQTIGRATNLSQKMVADILNGYDSASEVHQPQRHSSKVIALYRP
jgi:Zn-dependent peptidase ImmA (M78 family)